MMMKARPQDGQGVNEYTDRTEEEKERARQK